MQRNIVKLITATLILITLSTLTIAVLPKTRVSAEPALENDMPVVFVDPLNPRVPVGESFTISVKIFNLSDTFILTNVDWQPGKPPPAHNPGAMRNNYSLGNLYALDIGFTWDPTILEYVSHTATIPASTYTGGVLNEPIIDIKNVVNETHEIPNAPTPDTHYWLAQSSQYDAQPFNAPGANATVFTMTFKVKRNGVSALRFTHLDLADPKGDLPIPHWVKHGQFQTGALATRIDTLTVRAKAGDSLFSVPILSGESAAIQIIMINDNLTVTDTYDLALYYDGSALPDALWEDRVLDANQSETLDYLIQSPAIAQHNITARATILHGGETIIDELTVQFTAIGTPELEVDGPDSAAAGEKIAFTASGSQHGDPKGQILNYTWTLWAPGETGFRDEQFGETVEFQLGAEITKVGNWTVMLVVKDTYGITAQAPVGSVLLPTGTLRRTATAPYRATYTVNVSEAPPPSLFTIDNIVLILILVAIIAAAAYYLRRRSQ